MFLFLFNLWLHYFYLGAFLLVDLIGENSLKTPAVKSEVDLAKTQNSNLNELGLSQVQSFGLETNLMKSNKTSKRGAKLSTKQQLLDALNNKLRALGENQISKTAFHKDEFLISPLKYVFSQTDILKLEENFLLSLLKASINGSFKVSHLNCSWLILNPVIFDLETTENQLLIGFYFTSTNTFVQLLVDTQDNPKTKQKVQNLLKVFFLELTNLSFEFEKNWQKCLENEETSFIFTFLSGFNINNYDIPVISTFLEKNVDETDPVLSARNLAQNLLKFKDLTDYDNYSELLKSFLFVDIFWYTSGRLTTWVDILNESKQFKPLQKKRWKKSPLKRWDSLQINEWLSYNRNDLAAAHVLGLFYNNYFNFVLLRLAYSKAVGEQITLSSIFRDRYII